MERDKLTLIHNEWNDIFVCGTFNNCDLPEKWCLPYEIANKKDFGRLLKKLGGW